MHIGLWNDRLWVNIAVCMVVMLVVVICTLHITMNTIVGHVTIVKIGFYLDLRVLPILYIYYYW